MNNFIKAGIFSLTVLSTYSVAAHEGDTHDNEPDFLGGNFTGWVEFGNERMFRGNSETQNTDILSLQGLLTWTHADTGIYAGYWMATNKFDIAPDIYAESGPYIGKFGTAELAGMGFNYNVFLWHYIYHEDGVGQPNYTELWFTANKDVTENLNIYVEFVPTLDAWFGTKDVVGTKGNGDPVYGYATAITPTYKLGNGWSVNGTLGYQAFNKPQFVGVGDWMYANIGVAKTFGDGWKASLSYHDTNVDNDVDTSDIWQSHVVGSISKSF